MYNRYMQLHRDGEPSGRGYVRPTHPAGQEKSPTGNGSVGLKGILNGILGNRLEAGDLLLYLVLLLLYLEQEDEELLIVLAALVVLGFSDQEESEGRRKS